VDEKVRVRQGRPEVRGGASWRSRGWQWRASGWGMGQGGRDRYFLRVDFRGRCSCRLINLTRGERAAIDPASLRRSLFPWLLGRAFPSRLEPRGRLASGWVPQRGGERSPPPPFLIGSSRPLEDAAYS
jgi:hypothetical protein